MGEGHGNNGINHLLETAVRAGAVTDVQIVQPSLADVFRRMQREEP